MSALTMRWERIGTAMPPRKKAIRRQGRHSLEFKMQVVQYALSLPEGNRIKPTCRQFQNIAPVQVRKWLRAYEHTSPLSAELGDEDDDEDGEDSGSDDDEEEEGATPASKRRRLASPPTAAAADDGTAAHCYCGRPAAML
jgi:transposase-like protein